MSINQSISQSINQSINTAYILTYKMNQLKLLYMYLKIGQFMKLCLSRWVFIPSLFALKYAISPYALEIGLSMGVNISHPQGF